MSYSFLLLDDPIDALAFYKKHKDKTKFTQGDQAFVLLEGNSVIAALKLSTVAQGQQKTFFMRSVLVDVSYRGQGLALMLIQMVTAYIRKQRASWRCICFPYAYLQPLYERSGFTVITEQDLPSILVKSWNRNQHAIAIGRMSPVIIMQVKSG